MQINISKKYKIITLSILIGFIITGGFALFLIQRESVNETTQTLSKQIDILNDRVKNLETKQQKQHNEVETQNEDPAPTKESAHSTNQQETNQQKSKGVINVYFEKEGSEMKEIKKDHGLEGASMIASTRFQDSKTGLIFRTTEAITVPHGYFLSVPVIADKLGEEYLLKCSAEDPCSFTIPGYKGTEAYAQRYGKAFFDFTY